jgi:hypothetical protein
LSQPIAPEQLDALVAVLLVFMQPAAAHVDVQVAHVPLEQRIGTTSGPSAPHALHSQQPQSANVVQLGGPPVIPPPPPQPSRMQVTSTKLFMDPPCASAYHGRRRRPAVV